jgi:hypothetical protein
MTAQLGYAPTVLHVGQAWAFDSVMLMFIVAQKYYKLPDLIKRNGMTATTTTGGVGIFEVFLRYLAVSK